MKYLFSRRLLLAGGLALVAGGGALAQRPAMAHEAKCPICKLDVPQDTDQLDNEVGLRSGRKRIEYRCVYCALNDAKSYTGDLTILAPSEMKGKPVLLARKDGKWTATPETSVFVGQKQDHKTCPTRYRAFSTKAGFEAWVQKNRDLLGGAKPLSMAEMLEVAK